jgi:hypothetical protein
VKHFIRKSGSVFLDADLYKANPPSETVKFPPTEISGRAPTKANVDEYLWKMAQKHGLQDIYPALIGTVRTESGRTHWRRKGAGKILTSETGAKGLMQLMPKTAQGLGVEREDWRQNIEGGVKLWGINYNKAKKAGMPRSDAIDYAAMSYFSGGAGSKNPALNTSAVELHNQKALSTYRKEHPNATLWDIPSGKLKGAPSQVSRFGGVKEWRKNMKTAMAGGGGRNPETGEKNFGGALDKYAKGVEKRSETDRHYIPVGSSRPEAEKFGLKGYASSDRSVPVTQSRARPADLVPPTPKPKAVAAHDPHLRGPVSTSTANSLETSRREGLESASREYGLPSPRKVLNRSTQGPRVVTRPVPVKKPLFKSELFVEE